MNYYTKHLDFEEISDNTHDMSSEHETIYTEPYFMLTALTEEEISKYISEIESKGISVEVIASNYIDDDTTGFMNCSHDWYVENDINDDKDEPIFKLKIHTPDVLNCVVKLRPLENFVKENGLGWLYLTAYKNISYCCDDSFYNNEFKGFNLVTCPVLTCDLIKICESN